MNSLHPSGSAARATAAPLPAKRLFLPLLIIVSALLMGLYAPAARAQLSAGGNPVGYKLQSPSVLSQSAPAGAATALVLTGGVPDEAPQAQAGAPGLRALHLPSVTYSLESRPHALQGEWRPNPSGEGYVWQARVAVPEGNAAQFYFSRFHLQEGQRLFLLSADNGSKLGAFTQINNTPYHDLATAPLIGSEFMIEFQAPAIVSPLPFTLGSVTATLRAAGEPWFTLRNLECAPNVINYTPKWGNQIRSVVLMIVRGKIACTGALINNTAQDGKAYVLTASHCMNNSFAYRGDREYITRSARESVFFFNFFSPTDEPFMRGIEEQTLSGARIVALDEEHDLCLLEITGVDPNAPAGTCGIPPAYRPYFSGWNHSLTPPQESVVGLHHPMASVQRYSVCTQPVRMADYLVQDIEWRNRHWQIAHWEVGTTAGGSSGSPLFNTQGEIIGALSGGGSYCPPSVSTPDYYYSIATCWQNASAPDSVQLAPFLDPKGTGAESLAGYDPFATQPVMRLSHFLYSPFRDNLTPADSLPESLRGAAAVYPILSDAVVQGVIPVVGGQTVWPRVELVLWKKNAQNQSTALLRKILSHPVIASPFVTEETVPGRTLAQEMQFYVDLSPEQVALQAGDTLFVALQAPQETAVDGAEDEPTSAGRLLLPVMRTHTGFQSEHAAVIMPQGEEAWRAPQEGEAKAYWIDVLIRPLEAQTDSVADPLAAPKAYFLTGDNFLVLMLPAEFDPGQSPMYVRLYNASGVPVAEVPVTSFNQYIPLDLYLPAGGTYVATLVGGPKRASTVVFYRKE